MRHCTVSLTVHFILVCHTHFCKNIFIPCYFELELTWYDCVRQWFFTKRNFRWIRQKMQRFPIYYHCKKCLLLATSHNVAKSGRLSQWSSMRKFYLLWRIQLKFRFGLHKKNKVSVRNNKEWKSYSKISCENYYMNALYLYVCIVSCFVFLSNSFTVICL